MKSWAVRFARGLVVGGGDGDDCCNEEFSVVGIISSSVFESWGVVFCGGRSASGGMSVGFLQSSSSPSSCAVS